MILSGGFRPKHFKGGSNTCATACQKNSMEYRTPQRFPLEFLGLCILRAELTLALWNISGFPPWMEHRWSHKRTVLGSEILHASLSMILVLPDLVTTHNCTGLFTPLGFNGGLLKVSAFCFPPYISPTTSNSQWLIAESVLWGANCLSRLFPTEPIHLHCLGDPRGRKMKGFYSQNNKLRQ